MFGGRRVFWSVLLAASCPCSLVKEDTSLDSALKMDEAWSVKRALSCLRTGTAIITHERQTSVRDL